MHAGWMGLSNAQSICNASRVCTVCCCPYLEVCLMFGASMLAELQKQVLQCWQQHLQWQQAVDFRLDTLQSCVSQGALQMPGYTHCSQWHMSRCHFSDTCHISDPSQTWYDTHFMARTWQEHKGRERGDFFAAPFFAGL